MGAREKIFSHVERLVGDVAAWEITDEILAEHRLEIAEEIQATMEKIRLEDWGRSTRSKPSWLRALAVARRIVAKGGQ